MATSIKKLLLIILFSGNLISLACAQSVTAAIAQVDVHAEVNAALYAASATLAAAERMADEKLHMQRKEIDALRAKVQAGKRQLNDALSTAEASYITELAERDRSYAHEIAVFRAAVENIASTPEGAAALARFNAGDEIGALAVLDDLRAARDAARKKRMDIESAAEGRDITALALEARNNGKITTAQVIVRLKEVTQLDPSVFTEWIELSRLYRAAGSLPNALHAANAATNTATNKRDYAVVFNELGDIKIVQGDLTAALKNYQASLTISKQLTQFDPGNAKLQNDLLISHIKIGDIQVVQGDFTAALKSYQTSLAISKQLTQFDPSNTQSLRDLSISHDRIGDAQLVQGDFTAALKSYQMSLTISKQLTQSDLGNAQWPLDLITNYVKLNEVTGDKTYVAQALDIALTMQKHNILAPRDAWIIEDLRRRQEQQEPEI